VDVDHVLRKEVNMDCVTPSHRIPIPHGESLDIYQLLGHPNSKLDSPINHPPKTTWPYATRKPVLGHSHPNLEYLDAQITKGERRAPSKRARGLKVDKSQRHADIGPTGGLLKDLTLATPVPTITRASRPSRPAQLRSSRIRQVVD
jgi:hypothetical protein